MCTSSASEYEDEMRSQRNQYDEGTGDYEFYNDRVQALKVVCQYFENLEREVHNIWNPDKYILEEETESKAWYEDRQFDS